jgi:hypothetical protein
MIMDAIVVEHIHLQADTVQREMFTSVRVSATWFQAVVLNVSFLRFRYSIPGLMCVCVCACVCVCVCVCVGHFRFSLYSSQLEVHGIIGHV